MKIKEKELELFINELKEIANQLGVIVRFEKGDFKGGYCIVKENKIIIINKFAPTQKKATILATALKELGIDDLYINPKTRELIDELTED
ncbi:MAG: hypothetical protein NZM09_04880 [Ignavibacterium sp.]|nr:hypothetical protein [Ignavibacterium sp.]MDW8375010.1 hypothetical protein [Ignavibacteriales bacterium]